MLPQCSKAEKDFAMIGEGLVPDVVGMPLDLAKNLLNEAHIRYNSVITYPTKSFFPLEDNGYYVVRQKLSDGGVLEITLAARLLKEVSGNGLQDW